MSAPARCLGRPWRGRSGPPVARFLLSASRAVIDPVKLIGQLRTELNGGEPFRMFSLQHLGIKTICAARLTNGAFSEIGTNEQITGAMTLRAGATALRAAVKSTVNVEAGFFVQVLMTSHPDIMRRPPK